MEHTSEFNLALAIEGFMHALNRNGMLSGMDEDELRDHLYLEVESLQSAGLTAEEAFMVSKKRLGSEDLIQEEYQKARPEKGIIRFLILALVFAFGLKMIFNLIMIVSSSSLLVISKLPQFDLNFYSQWGDLGLQIFTLLTAGLAGIVIFKRTFTGKVKSLWSIPTCYLISEAVRRGMYFLILPELDLFAIGNMHYNLSFLTIAVTVIGALASFWLIFRNREMKLAWG